MARNLFGCLKLDGKTGRGENPNGTTKVQANGDYVDGRGADGEDYVFGPARDGVRWNRTPSEAVKMRDTDVARPVVVTRRR